MSRPTLAQLEAFFWVAELGSVHRAAARLGMAQPTVSLRLRALQAGLPAPLLEPHGRGLRLTRAGHAFRQDTAAVLEAHARLGRACGRPELSGTVRVGLAEGFAVACLPPLVPALAREHPLLRPEWTVTTSAALEAAVLDGALDVAVLVDPIGDLRLGLVPLGSQRNVWAGCAALAARVRDAPGAMAATTVITTPPPTSMHRNTVAWFAGAGEIPGPLCLCTSVNAAAQLAAAGIGVGIFPARMVEAVQARGAPEGGQLVPIDLPRPPPPGHVFVAHRAGGERDRADAVAGVIREVTGGMGYFDRAG